MGNIFFLTAEKIHQCPGFFRGIFTCLFFLFSQFPFGGAGGEVLAQFYNGSYQEFGKNRVQYDDFFWSYYKFENYTVYFYVGGKNNAIYTARHAPKILEELEKKADYYLEEEENISFILYNKLEHFHQGNIGLENGSNNDIGGVTRISGNNVFIYFDGSHKDLQRQIRAGLSEIIINQMMFGETWRDVVKNSALLTLPDWYVKGLVSYFSEPWDVDIDNRVKDGVLSGRFEKFNRMDGEDAKCAGHGMWNYIAETYGTKVIPNILYMTRISRNIESGFLFVLGSSLKTVTEESLEYYRKKYESEDESRISPSGEQLPVRTRKNRMYHQFRLSPDGRYAAFSSIELGQKKIWLYDFKNDKLKKISSRGHKLQRINDDVYPLLSWHPEGKVLSIISEKKGQVQLTFFTPDSSKSPGFLGKGGKFQSKPIFKLEKVLDFSYSADGKNLVISAIANGQSDIFIYKIGPNIQEAVTNDYFDDFYPAYLNQNDIVFSSNRSNDTLKPTGSGDTAVVQKHFDLFLYNSAAQGKVRLLKHVTHATSSEVYAAPFSKGNFTFLSDENGIRNRYSAYFDSVISHIDTAFHYRYITRSIPATNYSRNILEQSIELKKQKYSEVVFENGQYGLFYGDLPANPNLSGIEMENTGYKEKLLKEEELEQERMLEQKEKMVRDSLNLLKSKPEIRNEKISYQTIKIPEETPDTVNPSYIDINHYKFSTEKAVPDPVSKSGNNDFGQEQAPLQHSDSGIAGGTEVSDFVLPNQQTYNIHFNATEITTQFDFNFANQLYQRFNGGPYINPGMGTVVKIGLLDLFEDYRIEGGMRYAYNTNSNEYFVSLEDRSEHIDKKYILQRQTVTSATDFLVQKTFIHQGKYVVKYPLSEVAGLRGTVNLRTDKMVVLSTDRRSLEAPDQVINWAGLKLEYIFDNSIGMGRNLYKGVRAKLFAEHYRELSTDSSAAYKNVFKENSDIAIFGLDARYYQKIYRELIWASRLSASTSVGSRKLVYYLGSVDNWIQLSDKQRFDFTTPVSNTQNYYFQTLGTPMRGFIQNVRNGNSFVVLNTELRWPVFKFLMRKPIKSDFISNFQTNLFADAGTAWTGKSPYSEDNTFNENIITEKLPPGSYILLKNHQNPIVGGFGWGLRTRLWGYFIRFDHAWGVEDGIVQRPINYFSVGLDF